MKLTRRITDCENNPEQYKLCNDVMCITKSQSCPCREGEFQCSDKSCVPKTFICNGRLDCPGMEDEAHCEGLYVRSTANVIYGREKLRKKEKPVESAREGPPLHVILGVTGACIVIVTVISIALFVYWKQRYRIRKQSNSGNEPLKQDSTEETQRVLLSDARPLVKSQTPADKVQVHCFVPLPPPQRHRSNRVYNMISSIDTDFGEGLLCTSTPKQGIRRITKPYTMPETSPIKDTSKGDLSKNLNMSLFLPIT